MSILEAVERQQPDAEQGAQRIKRTLVQTFDQIESTLTQVHQLCERHGRKEVKKALGSEDKEVVKLYKALKELVEKHKPNVEIADLPK